METGDTCADVVDMVILLSQHAAVSTSDKQLEMWTRAAGDKRDTNTCIESDTWSYTRVHCHILMTLQSNSGGQDTRLMRECVIPLLHHICTHIKTEPTIASLLCETVKLCREKIENKVK